MAITTLDGVIAGAKPPVPYIKLGATTAAVAGQRGFTFWYASGNPSGSIAGTAGVNGEQVNNAISSSNTQGKLSRTDPVGAAKAYLARFTGSATTAGSLWLVDRLWQNSGLSVTGNTAMTATALPPRDRNGSTNGDGVLAAIEWSATGGAGTPLVTLSYTDSGGNAANGTFTAVTTPPIGTFEIFAQNTTPSTSGTGVRAPTFLTNASTRTSGTMHLVLFRVIAQLDVTVANLGNAIDALTSGMPEIYPYSVLQLVYFPSATATTPVVTGQYVETQG